MLGKVGSPTSTSPLPVDMDLNVRVRVKVGGVFGAYGATCRLRVVGGVIFFLMGYEMLQAHLSRTQFDDETNHEYINDISITPLGIPIICGPGAITTSILLMNESTSPLESGIVIGIIVLIIALTYFLLLGAKQVTHLIGENGNKVMLRLMGLIVMVIAVEFFFSGLTPIIRDIFRIQ